MKSPIRSSKTAAPVTAAKNLGNKNAGKFILANTAVAYKAPGKKTEDNDATPSATKKK